MTAILLPNGKQQYFTTAGLPAVGYKVATFDAGTSNPRTTWQDAGKVSANTNPVILDGRGEASIFWEGAYKVQLQDSTGAVIWTQDNLQSQPAFSAALVPATNNSVDLGSVAFTWRNIYAGTNVLIGPNNIPVLDTQSGIIGYYPKTSIETLAGVTPINFSYPSGYPERYGNNTTPGTTDMTAAVQAAINVGRYGGVTVVLGGSPYYANASGYSWPYLVTSVLNCTPVDSATPIGFTIRCAGHNLADTNNAPYYPPIIARHNGVAVFDATGSYGINWENVSIGSDNVTFPKTGWLIARSVAGNSQFHRFLNCRAVGKFSVAILYNYGSEDCVYEGCQFIQLANAAGAHTVFFSGQNVAALASTYATIATGVQSTINHSFLGGTFANITNNAGADTFHLEGAINFFRMVGLWATCAIGGVGGHAIVYCDTTNNPIQWLHMDGVQVELQGTTQQSYGVLIGGGTNTSVGVYLANCFLPNNAGYLVAVNANQSFQQLTIVSPTQGAVNGGVNIPGSVALSLFETDAMNIVIGTSQNNTYVGQSNRWTITTPTNDARVDTGNPTWTPGTGGLTIVGGLTVTNKKVHYYGQRVVVTVQLQAATSIACAAGVTITGLPIASTTTGECRVINCSTPALVGVGTVSGTSMVLPAIGATAGLLLFVAEYFCS